MRYVILLLMAFSFIAWQNSTWKEFTSYEGRFRILAPGEMELKTRTIETAIGDIDYFTYLYQPEEKNPDNLAYMISYCDYPEYSVHSDSSDLIMAFFNTTVETAIKSVEGELMYTTDIQLEQQYPGRLWRINYNEDQASIKTKAYLVGRRYYSVQAITIRGKSLNPYIDKFLDSFSLIE
ncbi:MAG: hypothetical protein AAFP19_06485 [Bacteroidota bacterium]